MTIYKGKEMKDLPILKYKKEIIDTVLNNQVTIVVGETGCGKTTQIPQFLFEFGGGRGWKGKIGITQPRRVAAISLAHFIARQSKCKVGEEVGYKIRFDDSTTEGTRIKFMTDGILLREMQGDSELRDYSIIMVDEAHERSLNIDFLLGLLKSLLKKRTDLRVIVSSATIEEKKFSRYFSGSPVIKISGRMHPVAVCYHSLGKKGYDELAIKEAVVEIVKKIHHFPRKGDILVFLTGEDDVSSLVQEIEKQRFPNLVCLPLYGNMNFEDQIRVFEPVKGRKVVVATNIAETSVTINGIAYVIDSGYVKEMHFHPETGISSLDRVKASRASVEQRAGRAGRTQPGICYRLYSQEDFDTLEAYTVPEIQRIDLAGLVLQMRTLGIADIENFDFIDPPNREAFQAAHQTLVTLGALDENNGITRIGELMAALPLEPRLSRMVVAAKEYGCVSEVCTIAAALSSIRSVFVRPKGKEKEADQAHRIFRDPNSDFLTFLNVYKAYKESEYSQEWCSAHFLNGKVLEEIKNIRKQLLETLFQVGIPDSSGDRKKIAKAVAAGLVQNLCRHQSRYMYRKGEESIFIHPNSSLFGTPPKKLPEWIVASDIIVTTNTFARNCGAIEPQWIEEIAPQLCKKRTEFLSYDKETGLVIGIEFVYYNLFEINRRKVKSDWRAALGKDFSLLEKELGLKFKNQDLLVQTFTHRSYLNENKLFPLSHNERLEFLGDGILDQAVREFLYQNYPEKSEGEMTEYKNALVNTRMLETIARKLGLNDFLLLSRGELRSLDKKARRFILAGVFEALIGAMYFDQGYKQVQKFLEAHLLKELPHIIEAGLYKDAKTRFQEKAQERVGITPTYKILNKERPAHAPWFTSGVFLGEELVAKGEGLSKKEAEEEAARNALEIKKW